jgi:glycosyltransferase involved in cell wall biosynthesis
MEQIKKKIKVWMFHPESSDESLGGMPRPRKLGENLLQDYQVTVFSSSQLRQEKENLIKDNSLYLYRQGNVPFYYVRSTSYQVNDKKRIISWISYYINVQRVAGRLIKKEGKPDIIVGSSPHPLAMLAAVNVGKRYKIPVINEIRDYWPEVFFLGGVLKETSILGRILLAGEKYIYKNSNSLIFLKEGDFQYIVDRKWDTGNGGPIDLSVCSYINNGVEIDEFERNMEKFKFEDDDLDNDKFKAVYVGGLGKVNNLDKILDAAKLIENKDVLFLIYGFGDQQNRLKQRIETENIENVKLKGYVENKYIPYILSRASVNLLNYNQDQYNWSRGNSSNRLFEYMASGKPVISTVKMGYSIIEKYNCGVELQDQRPEAIKEAVKHFYQMPFEKLKEIGENAKKGARDFDYKIISEKFAQAINKTIGGYNG